MSTESSLSSWKCVVCGYRAIAAGGPSGHEGHAPRGGGPRKCWGKFVQEDARG